MCSLPVQFPKCLPRVWKCFFCVADLPNSNCTLAIAEYVAKLTEIVLALFKDELGLGGPVVRPLAAHAKGPGFDSPIAQHIQRLISLAFTYGAVGSLVLHSSWARQPGIISFRFNCVIILGKGYVLTICLSLPSYPSLRDR